MRTTWIELLVTDFVTFICICCLVFLSNFVVVVAELLDTAELVRRKCAVTQQVVVEFMLVHHRSLLADGRVVLVVVGQRRDHRHLSQHMVEDMCLLIHSLAFGVEGDVVEDHTKGSLGGGDGVHKSNVVLDVEFLVGAKGKHACKLLLVGVAMLIQHVTMLLQRVP